MTALCGSCFGLLRPARRKLSFLLIGLDKAGKSTISACLQKEPTDAILPTMGFVNGNLRLRGCDVALLDLGGSASMREIWSNYYAETHGIIFVADASDPSRFGEARSLLDQVLSDDRLKEKPLLIFANKQDREGAVDEVELHSRLGVHQLISGRVKQCRLESCTGLRSAVGGGVDRSIRRGAKWLLKCVQDDFAFLSNKIALEHGAQKASEAAERKARSERVRLIREERERAALEAGETTAENEDGLPENPFKPINSVITDIETRVAARKAKKAEPQELLDNLPCPEMGIASAVTKSTIRSLNTSQVGKAVNANSNQVQVEIHMSGSVKGGREVQTSSSIEDCLLHDVHSDGPGAASTAVNVAGSSLSVPGTVIPQEEEVVRIRYKENTTEETAKSPALISGRTNGVRLEPLKLEDLKSRKKKKPAVLFPWYKVQPDSSEGSVGSDEDGATVSRKGPAALPLGGDPPVECPPDPPLLPVIHNVMVLSPGQGDTECIPGGVAPRDKE